MSEPALILAKSIVIPGNPVVYVADPLGKAYAVHESYQMWDGGVPGDSRPLRRIKQVEISEVEELYSRSRCPIPLAKRPWWEVVGE